MKIVFDIDNTITKESEFIIKNGKKYLEKKYNLEFEVKNYNGSCLSEIFDLYNFFKDNYATEEEILNECKKEDKLYNKKYFLKYVFYPLHEEAYEIIKELNKNNHSVSFITLRGIKHNVDEKFFDFFIRKIVVTFLTKLQLKINRISYDKVYFVETNEEKKKIVEKIGASVAFDDNVDVINSYSDIDVIPYCIEVNHNINCNFDNERVEKTPLNKDIILSYIKKYDKEYSNLKKENTKTKQNTNHKSKKIKNLKIYNKFATESFYKLVRFCGKGFVLKIFNPLVIGQENLPDKKGKNLFVGNHRNIKDPLITIALLKNPTHFAALKRMFDYNENIFGKVGKNPGTLVTTLFVKSMGALPIARPSDENYMRTNFQTFKYIEEYLSLDSSVAIYPEGTLNKHPQIDGNLLPLKSNHSFKLAENGKAVVRPVAIVWVSEEIDIENKVILAFLKPIYTEGLKVSEIADIWQKSMNNALESINLIVEEMVKIKNEEYSIEGKEKVKIFSENINKL